MQPPTGPGTEILADVGSSGTLNFQGVKYMSVRHFDTRQQRAVLLGLALLYVWQLRRRN
jgi:hypothetical protein